MESSLTKLTELEYNALCDSMVLSIRSGKMERDEYYALLKKLSALREIAESKPEVKICDVEFEDRGDGGEVAHGFALDHPRLGAAYVRTSLVLVKAEDGSYFETLNTRYVIVSTEEREKLMEARRPKSQTV